VAAPITKGGKMLGEKIAEFAGKTTGRRVIPNDEHGPKMELSMEQAGKFYGVDVVDYGTYESVMVGKHLEGKGQGIMMTPEGESVTWTATGVGTFTGKGMGLNWRGMLTYRTESQKLARANGTCFVFEYDIDETGNGAKGRVFEWK
jgi:hypothetical protein